MLNHALWARMGWSLACFLPYHCLSHVKSALGFLPILSIESLSIPFDLTFLHLVILHHGLPLWDCQDEFLNFSLPAQNYCMKVLVMAHCVFQIPSKTMHPALPVHEVL